MSGGIMDPPFYFLHLQLAI